MGLVAMSALCDAVVEITTGQASDDQKAELKAGIKRVDWAEVERFYEGARTAFMRNPRAATLLFMSVSLADIKDLPEDERAGALDDFLATLAGAERLGYLKKGEVAGLIVDALKT